MISLKGVTAGALANVVLFLGKYKPVPGEVGVVAPTYPTGDARRYGAVAGGGDVTIAIQRAIDAAALFGGEAFVPAGVFTVSATNGPAPGTAGFYALRVPSGVTLRGAGFATVIKCVTDGGTVIVASGDADLAHVTDAVVCNLSIVGGDVTNNGIGRGVLFFRADRCVLQDCRISAVRLGVQIDRASTDTTYSRGNILHRVIVRDTVGTTTGNGTGFFASGVDGLVMGDIAAIDVAEHGFYLSQDSHNVTVNGALLLPKVHTNQNCGVQVFTAEPVPNIRNLTFNGVIVVGAHWGILLSASGGGKITQVALNGCSVTGCELAGVILSNVQGATINGVVADGTTAGSGIEADASQSISLNGCCSTGNFRYGALFAGSVNCSVTGGDYVNNDTGLNGNGGIRFGLASTGGKVTGARCTDNQASKTQAWGILADDDSGVLTVLDADVSGNRVGPINLGVAVNCIVRHCRGFNPVGPNAVAVTASPMTYTAGNSDETLYIFGGTVSLVETGGHTIGASPNASVALMPHQSVTITYSVAPTLTTDVH